MSEVAIANMNIESAIVPVDLQTGANAGDWVSFEHYRRCVIVFFKGAGTAGDDPVISVLQATAADGTGSKALNTSVVYSKVGTLTSIAQWTRNTQTAAATYTDATSAEATSIFAIEVQDSDLDLANDFAYVSVSVADVGGNAQLGCALYLMMDPRNPQQLNVDAKV